MALELTVMSLDFESEETTSVKRYNKKNLIVGRSSKNDVVLKSPAVSAQHARIEIEFHDEQAVLYVTDLGSTNGTHVDNKRLAPHTRVQLDLSQRIMIGQYLLRPALIAEYAESAANANTDESIMEDYSSLAEPAMRLIKGGRILHSGSDDLEESPRSTAMFKPEELFDEGDPLGFQADQVATGTEEVEAEVHEIAGELGNELAVDLTAANEFVATDVIEETDVLAEAASVEVINEEIEMENLESGYSAIDFSQHVSVFSGIVSQDYLELDFEAKRLLKLVGIITHKGVPLAGAVVSAGKLGEVVTDASGAYEFIDILEGTEYSLSVSKDSFKIFDAERSGSLEEDAFETFEAIQLFTLRGRIVHHGKGLADVEVDGGVIGKTYTDADGFYSFVDVAEDTQYKITARKDGFLLQARA